MQLLFTLDSNNYSACQSVVEKSSIRAIIIKDGKLYLQQDSDGYYKLSGGGPENDEDHLSTLKREVAEELGRNIIPSTMSEIGYVDEVRADIFNPSIKYICHTYYYRVDVDDSCRELKLTESEHRRGFHFAEATMDEIIDRNSKRLLYNNGTLDKDTEFLKWYKEHK